MSSGAPLWIPQPDPVVKEPLPLYLSDEPVVGLRIWRIEEDLYGGPILCSVAKPTGWRPCEALHAACWNDRSSSALAPPIPQHRAPWPDGRCGCGIWAFKDGEQGPLTAIWAYGHLWTGGRLSALDRPRLPALAIGEVSLWGRVVECEHGYRGEQAYPRSLTLIDSRQVVAGPEARIPERSPQLDDLARRLQRAYRVPVAVASAPPAPTLEALRLIHQHRETRMKTRLYQSLNGLNQPYGLMTPAKRKPISLVERVRPQPQPGFVSWLRFIFGRD